MPTYSPELSPIETVFASLKKYIKKYYQRTEYCFLDLKNKNRFVFSRNIYIFLKELTDIALTKYYMSICEVAEKKVRDFNLFIEKELKINK